MLALAIISAVAGALTTAGMFLAWSIRYARSEEHRLTQLEGKAEANGKELSEIKRRIDRLEDNVKRR